MGPTRGPSRLVNRPVHADGQFVAFNLNLFNSTCFSNLNSNLNAILKRFWRLKNLALMLKGFRIGDLPALALKNGNADAVWMEPLNGVI